MGDMMARRRDADPDPARHPRGRAHADLRARSPTSPTTSTSSSRRTPTCWTRLLSRVDHIAANVEGVTTAEAGDVKESIKNVREITESIKSLIGTTQGQVAETGDEDARVDRQAAVDDRQPRQDDEEHRGGHRADRRRERARSAHLLNDDTIARNVEDITEDAGGFIRGITQAADHRGAAHRVQLPLQLVQELPLGPADAPARQVLSDRARRGPARLPHDDDHGRHNSSRPERRQDTTDHADRPASVHVACSASGSASAAPPRSAAASASRSRRAASAATSTSSMTGCVLSVDVFGCRDGQPVPAHQGDAVYAIWKRNLFLIARRRRPRSTTPRAEPGAGGGVRLVPGRCSCASTTRICKSLLLFGGGAAAGAAQQIAKNSACGGRMSSVPAPCAAQA